MSVISSTAASARLTTQPCLAFSAASWKASSLRPGTRPTVRSAIEVMVGFPSTKRSATRASVLTDWGAGPVRQDVRERHRETGRVGGADQLLGVDAFPVFEA